MSREARKVTADWVHPKNGESFIPLFEGFNEALKDWEEEAEKNGVQAAIDYFGEKPSADDYMPEWCEDEKTHFMMYETTSEGTPISPSFKTPEELAKWLFDNNVGVFSSITISYEKWLEVASGGIAPPMSITSKGIQC